MPSHLVPGLLAAAAAASIGAAWQVATRHGVTTSLGPLDLAWLRYAVPSLLLLPVLLPLLRRVQLRLWTLLVATGGLPFGLLVLAGAQWAPAAHLGVFMAGAMPLFTAAACWWWLRERVEGRRWIGLAVLACGIAVASGAVAAHAGSWRGDVLFVIAAAVWAVYTVLLRGSGLTAWQAAAVVNSGSALLLLVALPWLRPARLFTAPIADVLLQAACQGVLAGLLGLASYTAAVRLLGPARAALSAAAVPLLTAGGAWFLLGEPLDGRTMFAGALVAAGIALASGRRTS